MIHGPGGEPPKVLTIAGSDSGGAAGLQADLKCFSALGVYGMSVVTAVTAQNSLAVAKVHWIPIGHILAQLDAVMSDYGAAAVKTGFLGRADVVQAVAGFFRERRPAKLVVDPVLVNHHGQAMFTKDVAMAYVRELFPLADLVTPNVAEASLLAERPIDSGADLEDIARTIQSRGPESVLITGARDGDDIVDHLVLGDQYKRLRTVWIETDNTHGSGDALTAAICSRLSQDNEMYQAIEFARQFTWQAIERGSHWHMGGGHGPIGYPTACMHG